MMACLPFILIVLSAFLKYFDDERDPEDLHLQIYLREATLFPGKDVVIMAMCGIYRQSDFGLY